MSMLLLFWWFCASSALELSGAEGAVNGTELTKLNVSIFYETLCKDSKVFLMDQVFPVYNQLKPYINVEFIPYGKATKKKVKDGSWKFTCQHGEEECLGNMVQSCVLSKDFDLPRKVKFIGCFMKNVFFNHKAEYMCTKRAGIPFDPVHKCVQGPEGGRLLAANGNLTNLYVPNIEVVPSVAIDGDYDALLNLSLTAKFYDTIAALLKMRGITLQ